MSEITVEKEVDGQMSSLPEVQITINDNEAIEEYKPLQEGTLSQEKIEQTTIDDRLLKVNVKTWEEYLEVLCNDARLYDNEMTDIWNKITEGTFDKTFAVDFGHNNNGSIRVTYDKIKVDLEHISPFFKISIFYKGDKTPTSEFELHWTELKSFKFKGNDELTKPIMNCLKDNGVLDYIKTDAKHFNELMEMQQARKKHRESNRDGFEDFYLPDIEINSFGLAVGKKYNTETKQCDEVVIGSPCVIKEMYRELHSETKIDTLLESNIEGNSYVLRFKTPSGDIEERTFPAALIHDAKALKAHCMKENIPIIIKDWREFENMLILCKKKTPLQQIDAIRRVGWLNVDEGVVFVSGKKTYSTNSKYDNIVCSNESMREKYQSNGTLSNYLEGIRNLLNEPEIRVFMALDPAARMLSKAGITSFAINLWGGSSGVKTTRVKAAMTLSGNPNKIMMSMNASAQAPNKHLEKHRDCLLLFDEIVLSQHGELIEYLIKCISANETRNRYNYKHDENESKPISCIAVFTSEDDITSSVTADGTLGRCIQIRTDAKKLEKYAADVKKFEDMVCAQAKDAPIKNKSFGHLEQDIFSGIFNRIKDDSLLDFRHEVENEWSRRYPVGTRGVIHRINDIQVAIVMGFIVLEEVLDNLRLHYPWIVKMDPYEVVYNMTKDHAEEARVPQWVERTRIILANVDADRCYMNDPVPQGEQQIVHSRPIKGYIHTSRNQEELLCLNIALTKAFCSKDSVNIPYETWLKDMDSNGLLKHYKGNLTLQNPKKEALEGTHVIAINQTALSKHEYFRMCEEQSAEEKEIAEAEAKKKQILLDPVYDQRNNEISHWNRYNNSLICNHWEPFMHTFFLGRFAAPRIEPLE